MELPADRPRPSTWTFEGALESRLLPATLGQELKRVSARHDGTLFTTMLAAYAVWLRKLSGQSEIVIGIPLADRAMEGGGTVVGHCLNFLSLRARLSGETFAECLAGVQKEFLAAHEHRRCAFGSLIQKLNLPRNAARMPLVSVKLIMAVNLKV